MKADFQYNMQWNYVGTHLEYSVAHMIAGADEKILFVCNGVAPRAIEM